MSVFEIVLMSVALAMDACAVAMTNGMTDTKMRAGKALLIGIFFGFFQFLMPLIGYFITGIIADAFLETFQAVSAWISFVLLAFLGGKMLFECISEMVKEKREKSKTEGAGTSSSGPCQQELSIGKLTLQAVATSIDALAVGVTLQMAEISEGLAMGAFGSTLTIGLITLLLSVGAVYIGKAVGNKLADKAGVFGGAVLVIIGLKILIESFL